MWGALAPVVIKLGLQIFAAWQNRKLHRLETEKAEAQIKAKMAQQQAAIEVVHRELAVSHVERYLDIAKATDRKRRKIIEGAAKENVKEMSHAQVVALLRREGLLL